MYKSFKHLYLLLNKQEAIYLGYRVRLTKTEYAVLRALIENPGRPLNQAEISKLAGISGERGAMSYHVFKINSKAKAVGNRVLIKNISKNGYFLNEKM